MAANATHQTLNLYITYVDKEGPFLKVWGQAEKNNSIYVEQFLQGASQQFDEGIGQVPFEQLQVGTLVCAKYKDNKYYRARIVNIDYSNEFFVEVNFLDYGNRDIVPSGNIRSLQNFAPSFISIPPLATGFIFAEAHCPGGGEWKDQIFEVISTELRYREFQCHLLTQATQYYLIKLYLDQTDVGSLFISRGLMQPVPLHAQQGALLSMSLQRKPTNPVPPPAAPATINTYKACSLEPQQVYAVYVSFINEGPTHFSVQLEQSEHMMAKLMKDINEINLRMLEEVPLPGTICLARCQEDGNVCRAVVTNEVDNQFKVFFVDFGNYETLPLDALYQIPFKYVLPKVMAIRLALNGVEKSSVTMDMLLAFKKFVDNRLLHMKVLNSPKKTVIPKCELWDPQTKTSALDVINSAAQHAYPEPLLLNRGFTQLVKVSYVFSCSRFYVQLVSKEQELTKLMADLQSSCGANDVIDPTDIKLGIPCCALFEVDQLWYRSEIVDVVDRENVKVRYIDYGNEEIVPVAHLKMVDGELLTILRPQAIECCLNGYQNMSADETRDNLLEELVLEQNFTMRVSEMLGKKALVELIDSSNYNVASLLLDKIAMAKSQVSPMLVQAGNKIEHRKSQTELVGDNFRQQRKPARDNKDWSDRNDRNDRNFDRPNEKSWRTDKKDFRNNENTESSPDRSSWRQNNKGFNRNDRSDKFDRNDRDDRSNKPNINERFNPDRNRNDNWNKRDNDTDSNRVNAPIQDSWDGSKDTEKTATNDDWSNSSPVQNEGRQRKTDDKFGQNKRRFDSDGKRSGWENRDGFKKDNYKKDFRKDGSELSSSGSEKSFQKGPRTSSRNDHAGGRFQNRSKENSFANTTVNESWSVSDVSTPIDAAPSSAIYGQLEVVGTEAAVVISWFHNPGYFYCQLQSTQPEFRTLMEEIQQFYKNRKPESCSVGSPVVGLFPEDNVLYRAQILEALGGQYKVFYVDFGNISTITKVWPIEKKFMTMPAQAISCGLSFIGPNDENWPEASSFSKFFQKDSFMARFLDKDENRTYLELWDNTEEISQLLIQEGLAVSLQPPSSDIDISLLLGQQFRVILKSVNNLSDIIVALECGLALNCKMHNLESASESYEDVLKNCLEQVLIVYVDNILENNVLDVTFYDNDGNKLVIITPDEGALDNVEPLCPPLIISSHLYGYVSHADETSIFVQPTENADQVAQLLEKMYEIYENMTQDTPIIPEEGLIYAVHSSDTNWYRGRVTDFDDNTATVVFVDYGNSESVAFNELRELQNELMVPNVLSVQITISSVPPQSLIEKEVVASIYYGETGWEGIVEEYNAETQQPLATEAVAQPEASQDLALEGTLVKDSALPEGVQEIGEEMVEVEKAEELIAIDQKGTPVFVSHIDSPTEFYVQFAKSTAALEELQQNLQDTVNEMPVLESITVGQFCAAPYSGDHQWYRAEVLDADDDITTVRFVDYGNTDVINNKKTEIKELPSNLLSLAVYATRCSLKLKAKDEEWSQPALELFEALANSENTTADFVIQDEKTNYVELYANNESIKEALINQNLAMPCEIVTESKTTCFVSHLNSPSEFWVQLEHCINELEWIAEQLSTADGFTELEDMAPGTLCAALFPDDEMWYRARILSNTVAGIELLFIDYGNSCVSSSLRQLPEDLVVTSALAQKCCLQKPEDIPYWTKEASDKFTELSAEGQTIFELRKISTGETATVELLLNGESIVPMILPITKEGYVKKFETLDKFTVEKNGELSQESFSLEPMPGLLWDDASSKKFLELYPEGTLFQIEIIGEDILRLYQNGADIRPNLGGVKNTLNLSNTQESKTENMQDISEDHVIDYNAGGDNLCTKHSIEAEIDSTQDATCASEKEADMTDTLIENYQFCDTNDTSAEQDNTGVSATQEENKVSEPTKGANTSQDSETDSGHHSEHEVPKEESQSEDSNSIPHTLKVVDAEALSQEEKEPPGSKTSESPKKEESMSTESEEVSEDVHNEDSNDVHQNPEIGDVQASPQEEISVETNEHQEIKDNGSKRSESPKKEESTSIESEEVFEDVCNEGINNIPQNLEVEDNQALSQEENSVETNEHQEIKENDSKTSESPKKEESTSIESEEVFEDVCNEGINNIPQNLEVEDNQALSQEENSVETNEHQEIKENDSKTSESPKKEETLSTESEEVSIVHNEDGNHVTQNLEVKDVQASSQEESSVETNEHQEIKENDRKTSESPKKEDPKHPVATPNENLKEDAENSSYQQTEESGIKTCDNPKKEDLRLTKEVVPSEGLKDEQSKTDAVKKELKKTVQIKEQVEENGVETSESPKKQDSKSTKCDKVATPCEGLKEKKSKQAMVEEIKPKEEDSYSRPGSADSGRIKHDDRIVPAVISRPHTPLSEEDDNGVRN